MPHVISGLMRHRFYDPTMRRARGSAVVLLDTISHVSYVARNRKRGKVCVMNNTETLTRHEFLKAGGLGLAGATLLGAFF